MTTVIAEMQPAQICPSGQGSAYRRVTIDNTPINVMGAEMVRQFQEVIDALGTNEHLRVVDSGQRTCNDHGIERSHL
jgi:enoyl-CoA hydratase/carnithine racemase